MNHASTALAHEHTLCILAGQVASEILPGSLHILGIRSNATGLEPFENLAILELAAIFTGVSGPESLFGSEAFLLLDDILGEEHVVTVGMDTSRVITHLPVPIFDFQRLPCVVLHGGAILELSWSASLVDRRPILQWNGMPLYGEKLAVVPLFEECCEVLREVAPRGIRYQVLVEGEFLVPNHDGGFVLGTCHGSCGLIG